MKIITIDDFGGGRNNFDDQRLLAPNECVVTSQNVWAPQKALIKFPATTLNQTLTSTAGTNAISIYQDDIATTARQLYFRIGVSPGAVNNPFIFGGNGNTLLALGYTTGTIALTNGTKSATGIGTLWASAYAMDSTSIDRLTVDTGTTWYQIASIQDDTHLTLVGNFVGANSTGTYIINPSMQETNIPWASFIGSWWSCSTGNILQRYDGTGITKMTTSPMAAYLAVHKNYLFTLKTAANPSRLQWSAIRNPASWPSNNFIDIEKDKGDGAGLFSFGNELMIFKTKGIYKIIGEVFDPANPSYAIYPISVPTAFQFHSGFSPTAHNGLLYFFCHNGMYVYRPGTTFITEVSTKFSRDMPDVFSTINTNPGVSTPAAESIYGISTNGFLMFRTLDYLTTGGNIAPKKVGILDHRNAWWVGTDVTGASVTNAGQTPWAILTSASWSRPKIVFMPGMYTYFFEINQYFDGVTAAAAWNGSTGGALAIPAEWRSKEFNIEYGFFHKLIIYLKKQTAGSLSVDWSIDQASFVVNTVDMTVGRGNLIRSVLNINQKGSTIQIRVTNSTVNQDFGVYSIKIYYTVSEEERLT